MPPPSRSFAGPAVRRRRGRAWRWLFVLPMIGLGWVPFYNRAEPALWGVPFFYWYQLVWVFITSALTLFVLRQERE
jgi:hypothetical protein